MQDLKDQNSLLKAQKSGVAGAAGVSNGHTANGLDQSSQFSEEIEKLKSQLSEKDSKINELSSQVAVNISFNIWVRSLIWEKNHCFLFMFA